MKKTSAPADKVALTASQIADLAAAQAGPPNTVDIPEAPAENWRQAKQFFRPRKEAVSIRLDADVLNWLRLKHERYQSEINRILREKMEGDLAG